MRSHKKCAFTICSLALLLLMIVAYFHQSDNLFPNVLGRSLTEIEKRNNEKANIFVTYMNVKNKDRHIRCRDAPRPAMKHWDETWQRVANANLVLYAAFLDDRVNDVVRILGMTDGHDVDFHCQVWEAEGAGESASTPLSMEEIWVSNWDSPDAKSYYYRPFLLTCPLPPDTGEKFYVSVTRYPCEEQPENVYHILRRKTGLPKKDFVVCLKPLNFDSDISDRLLEWLELQFLLGADKVSVYVSRLHRNVTRLLEHYRISGKVSLKFHKLPERLPEAKWRSIKIVPAANDTWQKRRHEIVPYNDCFYRHLQTHRQVVLLDLDEAIVPQLHGGWRPLLDEVIAQNPEAADYSSISVSNVYFFDSFGESNDLERSIPKHMRMLRHVYRSANFTPPGFAMKSFFSTENALMVFNHYALASLRHPHYAVAPIGRQLAQLHHYRAECPPLMEKACEENYMKFKVRDTSLWKFKDALVKNVEIVRQKLKL